MQGAHAVLSMTLETQTFSRYKFVLCVFSTVFISKVVVLPFLKKRRSKSVNSSMQF